LHQDVRGPRARGRRGDSPELEAIDKEVETLIDDAVVAAKNAPLPTPGELTTDVYVSY